MRLVRKHPIAAVLAAFVLVACGGGGQETASQPPAQPQAVAEQDLERAVRAALNAAKSEQVNASYGQVTQAVVEPHKQSAEGDWVFGGAYFPVPADVEDASPIASLFVARKVAGQWEVSLEDSEPFAQAVQSAPESIVSDDERRVFSQRADSIRRQAQSARDIQITALGQDVGLSMPFALRGSAWGTAGVHGDGGSTRPYNAIDFWGGDGRVLASRAGIAYKFCTNSNWPYIKVVHDNGWTTGYYHLRNQASISNGQRLAEGQFIGMIGVELPCGGRASGNHVHWTLWRGASNGAAETVNNKLIGGWTWHEGSQAYSGYAERNGVRVNAGWSGLVNYGHGTTTPPPTDPCSGAGCERYTGSFSASGRFNVHPSSSGFQFGGGTLKAWLNGPAGTDFDLILGRYNRATGQWDKVASSEGNSSEESLSFNAAAGTYRWRINAYSGTGGYTLWTQR